MNDWTKAWLVMICITLMFWLGQKAILNENPNASLFLPNDPILGNTQTNPTQINRSPLTDLPGENTIQTDGSLSQQDQGLNVLWSWMGSAPGAKYITGAIAAPNNIMIAMGVPSDIAFGISALWYAIMIILTIMLFSWRQ